MPSSVQNEKEKDQHIQVFVRCRPLNEKEKKTTFSVLETSDREVHAKTGTNCTAPTKTFKYDKVYGPKSKQITVYKEVAAPLIDEVMAGYNCTVFAYGQTGTGKTFTMEGERSKETNLTWNQDSLEGIIPRAMQQLFTRLAMTGCEFSVLVSFLEIYNEELIDLLGPETGDNPRLKIYDDSVNKGSCIIQGLEEVVVRNKHEIYQVMDRGWARRQTAATLMNAQSSRSHCVFMVTTHIRETSNHGEEMVKMGKLNLVDLAGSECIGRSGAVEKRAREAGNINQSLLTLGRVITALVEHHPHIPYRESKLTRLLKDSLGGRTKTAIIATVSPGACYLDETLSTLEYALRAKSITNRPEINQKLTKKALLKEYTNEIERLRRDLQAARDKNGIFLSQTNYDDMQLKIQQQENSITDLTEQINGLMCEMTKLSEMFTDAKQEVADLQSQLEDLRDTLQTTRLQLQETIQDRDEQSFLVQKHVSTENELASQADQLLSTLDEATADVYGLHAKLDRKRTVDEHNETAREQFRSSFRTNIDSMKKSIQIFAEEQEKSAEILGASLDQREEERISDIKALYDHLDTIKSLQSKTKCLDDNAFSSIESSKQWAKDLKDHCLHSKDEEIVRQSEFHENSFIASMKHIENFLKDHVTALQHQAALQTEQMKEQQSRLTSFMEGMKQQLLAQEELAKSVSSSMEASVKQQEQLMKECLHAQDDLHKMKAQQARLGDFMKSMHQLPVREDDIMGKPSGSLETSAGQECAGSHDEQGKEVIDQGTSMQQLVSQMVSSRREQLTASVARFEQGSLDMVAQMKQMVEAASSRTQEAISYGQQNLEAMHTLSAEQDSTNQQTISLRCTNVEDIMKSHNKLNSDVSSFTHSTSERCSGHAQSIVDIVNKHIEDLTAAYSTHKESTQSMESECSGAEDAIKDETNQQEQRKSEILAQQAELNTTSQRRSCWLEKLSAELDARDSHVETFLTEDTKEDQPTGETPQSRRFKYPRVLSRTDRHSLLLQEFRRDYMKEAINNSIAFNMSDGNLLEEDGDQNTSADSAISAGSAVSSAPSDQGGLVV